MTLKSYLVAMTLMTAALIAILVAVIAQVDPFVADTPILLLFYALFFFSCAGLFSVAGFFIRMFRRRHEVVFRHVRITVRQGIFFACIVTAVLILQRFRIMSWLHIALLILFFTTLEVFLRAAPTRLSR